MAIKPLGQGYQPGSGNSPADNVPRRALLNALVAIPFSALIYRWHKGSPPWR